MVLPELNPVPWLDEKLAGKILDENRAMREEIKNLGDGLAMARGEHKACSDAAIETMRENADLRDLVKAFRKDTKKVVKDVYDPDIEDIANCRLVELVQEFRRDAKYLLKRG